MNNRIGRLKGILKENKIDGMIIYNPQNIKYLTDISVEGFLIINDSENFFVTEAMYVEEANNQLTLEDEITTVDVSSLNDDDYLSFFVNSDRVGFEENYITYSMYNEMIRKYRIKEAVETNNVIEKMRLIKDEDEIEKIETACNITDSCFLHLLDYIKEGMSENEISIEIYKFINQSLADGVAFDSIVASGENTAKTHIETTKKIIKNGDPIILEFGAKYGGYCAKIVRTIFLGNVSEDEKKLYNIVKCEQELNLEKMKNGCDISKLAHNNFNDVSFYTNGIGLDYNENPVLCEGKSLILKKNMVTTNDIGICIPGELGIRIADTVIIDENNAVALTKSNKNLLAI